MLQRLLFMCCEWNNDRSALIPRNLSCPEKLLVVSMSMHLEKHHAMKKRRSSAGQRRLSYAHNAWWNDDSSWKFPLQNIFTSTGKETLFKDRNYCLFMNFKFIHSPKSHQTATGEYVFHVNSSLYCQYPCTKALLISKDYNFKPYWALSKVNWISQRSFQ